MTEGTDMNQIEKVARAIGQIIEGPLEDMDSNWLGRPLWQSYEREAKAAIAVMLPVPTEPVAGWIVGDADQDKWRTWGALGPEWTTDRDKATRYARRCDAEQVHAEDMDAWFVVPFFPTPPAGGSDAE